MTWIYHLIAILSNRYLALLFRKRCTIYISDKWYRNTISKSTRKQFFGMPSGCHFFGKCRLTPSLTKIKLCRSTISRKAVRRHFKKKWHPPRMSENYWQTLLFKVEWQASWPLLWRRLSYVEVLFHGRLSDGILKKNGTHRACRKVTGRHCFSK